MDEQTLTQIERTIRAANRPLLICHVSPDADAVGSLVGMGLGLSRMGLEPLLACSDPIPARFDYIPGSDRIVREVTDAFDLVITLDCSDRERVGSLAQTAGFDAVPLVNIDHHVTNLRFGDLNLVDADASSTSEIVLRLLERFGLTIDAPLATPLLAGIVADTRGFRTDKATAPVLEAALRLMRAGASLPYISYHTFDLRPLSALLLWRAALARMQTEGRLIWTTIPLEMRRAVGYAGSGDAGLVSFLLSADTADIAAVFIEREGERVEVGLRAVSGLDVSQVALRFGGGGHPLAAGCTVRGTLEEVERKVLAALSRLVDE